MPVNTPTGAVRTPMSRTLSLLSIGWIALVGCGSGNDPDAVTPYTSGTPTHSVTATSVDWRTDAQAWRGMTGVRILFTCPTNGPLAPVYGSGPYTDNSSVCNAGVHAGRITFAGGGDVVIEIRAGAASYAASNLHGVNASAFGAYAGSFVVL